jgi:Arc/MetJ-type ribon-helix-helix transcriptional regulator
MANTKPKTLTGAITLRTDPAFLEAIEELRRLSPGAIPSKSDAIRDAVFQALERRREEIRSGVA